MRIKGLLAAFGLLGAVAQVPVGAAEEGIKRLYVFGDSLSDTGNVFAQTGGAIPARPNYFFGRFSNGPVWAEVLADSLRLPWPRPELRVNGLRRGLSYARGGSGTFESNDLPIPGTPAEGVLGLTGQVEKFLVDAHGAAPADALYVVWSGANDYSLSGLVPPPMPGVPGIPFPPDPEVSVENILGSVAALHAAGARRFVVIDLPDSGRIPLAELGDPELLSAVVRVHNELLRLGLAQLLQELPDATVTFVDAWALVNILFEAPSALGFGNEGAGPASGCLVPLPVDPPQFVCETRVPFDYLGSVIMDEQHPTRLAHELIAAAVERKFRAGGVRLAGLALLDVVDLEETRSFRVAVVSNAGFDASRLDASSLSFGPGRASTVGRMRVTDVNSDGLDDAVVRFRLRHVMPDCRLPALAMNGADVSAQTFLAALPTAALGCAPP